ncbi:MAG: hypothetical protein ABL971_02805 [Vicinamibacterales bacterium]
MAKKITVEVPEDLLRRAQDATGMGLTETVRRGLERVAADRAYDEIRKLRGKVEFPVGWKALRAMDE